MYGYTALMLMSMKSLKYVGIYAPLDFTQSHVLVCMKSNPALSYSSDYNEGQMCGNF